MRDPKVVDLTFLTFLNHKIGADVQFRVTESGALG